MSSEDVYPNQPRDPMDPRTPLDVPSPAGMDAGVGVPPEPRHAAPGGAGVPPASQNEAGMVAAGKETAQQVGATASEEAQKVAHEAKAQAKSLLSDLQVDLRDQAGKQQEKIAGGLRSMSDEFNTMLDASSGGQGAELVGMAGRRAEEVASWLENRDPGTMLEDVRRFARRRPGAFLAIALGAGLVAGRVARNLAAEAGNEPSPHTGRVAPIAPGPVQPSTWPTDATTSGAVGTSASGSVGMTPPGAVGTDEGSSVLPPSNPNPGSAETYP